MIVVVLSYEGGKEVCVWDVNVPGAVRSPANHTQLAILLHSCGCATTEAGTWSCEWPPHTPQEHEEY
jgi:hypothetical protein